MAQLNTPFSWPGEATLVDVLERARFADVVPSTHTIVMHFEEGIAQALTAMAATPIGPDLAALSEDDYERFVIDATAAVGRSESAFDPVDIPAVTTIATAWR